MRYFVLLLFIFTIAHSLKSQSLETETQKNIAAIQHFYDINACNCTGDDVSIRIYWLETVTWILHPDSEKSLIGHKVLLAERQTGVWNSKLLEKFESKEHPPKSEWGALEKELFASYTKDFPQNGDDIYRAGMSCPNSGTLYIEWCDKTGSNSHYFWECLSVVNTLGDQSEEIVKAEMTVQKINKFSKLLQQEFFKEY